jgi:hypothetical protein
MQPKSVSYNQLQTEFPSGNSRFSNPEFWRMMKDFSDPLNIASTAELAANGVRPDESRRNKEFVEVGQWAT